MNIHPITPCLWFDSEAEEAANFYVSVFGKDSSIGAVSRYSREAAQMSGRPEGSALTVAFKLNGQSFTALNGGPVFRFSEAISFQVTCDTQEEIDYYWEKLTDGGQEQACGWLKDKYGLSWQIVPAILPQLLMDPERAPRVSQVFMQMKKFDIDRLMNA